MASIRISLSRAQYASIAKRMRATSNKYEAQRCRIVLLLSDGESPSEVARMVGCVRATVYRTIYRFEEENEDGLLDGRSRREPPKATPDNVAKLLSYLDGVPKDYGWQRSVWTLELLSLQLENDTSVALSPSHIWRLLRREGCRRGRPRPALHIPVRGRRAILDAIEELVARASPEEEVFYADEADIDLNPRIGLTYVKRGQQPLVLTPGQNVKYYIAGALNARTGSIVYSHGTKKDSILFVDLLHSLRSAYRRAKTIHVVLDNYIIHKSQTTIRALEAMDGKIRLHFLPPYSPDHNPIERLWKQLHDNVTRNHRHATMQSLWCDVTDFLKHAQPFPGTKVSTRRTAA